MRILSPRQYLRPLLMCAASLGAASLSFSQSLTITSGQGQIVQNASVATQTLAVQLLDATGKPFPGQTVTFADTQGGSAGIATPNFAVTDSNGMAFTTFISNNIPLGNTVNYTQTNIIASYGGLSAVFTETTSATAPTGGSAVLVNVGSPQIGQLLTGGAGSTSSIPVKVQVTTLFSSLGIPNVAVSLRSNSTNNATIGCKEGPFVLTDSTGIATCTPLFGAVGNGSFAVVVGGGFFYFHQPISVRDQRWPSRYHHHHWRCESVWFAG